MRHWVSYGFLAPPNLFIVLCLLGAIVALVWRRAGITVVFAASLCLFVAATPAFSSGLLVWLETRTPKDADLSSAQAIVVLGADVRSGNGAIPDRLGPQSLERLVFAAEAYNQLHLPVAVSGGRISDWQTSKAAGRSCLSDPAGSTAAGESSSRRSWSVGTQHWILKQSRQSSSNGRASRGRRCS